MIILIAGDTHTGKTLLAQKLLEKYHFPYLSIDHLKMGLIRSGQSQLSPDSSDAELTRELWPIVREIIKTNIENSQNLILEGCYIPFGWEKDFEECYLKEIQYVCLIFDPQYLKDNFSKILEFENVIEKRLPAVLSLDEMVEVNQHNLEQCQLRSYRYILVKDDYDVDFEPDV